MKITAQGTQHWRVLELTGTTFRSDVLGRALMVPLIIVATIVVWHFIWQIAPIPSSQYPFAQTWWPLYATDECTLENLTPRWK